MTDEERVQRAKNLAAQKACDVYGQALQDLLKEAGLPMIASLAETTHVHNALLLVDGEALAVRVQWDFTSTPAIVEHCLALAKQQSAFPKA
jgi:hypothetical protein